MHLRGFSGSVGGFHALEGVLWVPRDAPEAPWWWVRLHVSLSGRFRQLRPVLRVFWMIDEGWHGMRALQPPQCRY